MKNKLIYIEIALLIIAIIAVSYGIVRIFTHPKPTINYVVKDTMERQPKELKIVF